MKKTALLLCTLLSSTTFSHNNIFEDVRAKNKEALKQRLENCEDCAVKDNHGNNALHIAAQDGDTEIIDLLTTAPQYEGLLDWFYSWFYAPTLPNIDEQNDDGDSPLHCTVNREKLTTAEQLVKKGARMNIVNKKGLSAPFAAILKDDPRFIKIFVAHKLNLEQHKRNGDTIFHVAIKERKPKSMHYCVQETTLHNVTNNEGKTPTFLVIDHNIDTLRMFNPSQLNAAATSTGIKPIHYATEHNKYDAINYLLNNNISSIDEPDTQGNTPLFYVNNEATLNFLLARGANLHKRNNKGEDILAVATHNKNIALVKVLTEKHNLNIDTRDNKGQTPFMSAAIARDYETMKMLIDSGANIRITDNMRETVLHKIAARTGDQRAAKIALEHDKALLTDLNKDGDSPLFIAVKNGNMTFADFLVDAGSRIDTTNNNDDTIIHELIKKNNSWLLNKLLKKVNPNIMNYKNKKGESPLLLAIHHDNVEMVKMLINHQAHIYTLDKYGNNIAHIAAGSGKMNVLTFLQSQQELLFRSRNNRGETPFVYAAQRGQLEATKLFLQNEDHFINGDVPNLANTMRNGFMDYDQQKVYDFIAQQHKNRLLECLKIVEIARAGCNLVKENNNLSKILSEKTSRPYHPESLYSYLSDNDLYKMTQIERNKVKNTYLERQNKQLTIKNSLEQKLAAIRASSFAKASEDKEEERKERERIRRQQELERQNRQTESERIAATQGTTIAQQKAELERIAKEKYTKEIEANNKRIIEESSFAKASEDRQEHSPIVPVVNRAGLEEGDCCISGNKCTAEHGVKRMPCPNCNKGSERTCQACLDEWITTKNSKNQPATCPLCREPLTK